MASFGVPASFPLSPLRMPENESPQITMIDELATVVMTRNIDEHGLVDDPS